MFSFNQNYVFESLKVIKRNLNTKLTHFQSGEQNQWMPLSVLFDHLSATFTSNYTFASTVLFYSPIFMFVCGFLLVFILIFWLLFHFMSLYLTSKTTEDSETAFTRSSWDQTFPPWIIVVLLSSYIEISSMFDCPVLPLQNVSPAYSGQNNDYDAVTQPLRHITSSVSMTLTHASYPSHSSSAVVFRAAKTCRNISRVACSQLGAQRKDCTVTRGDQEVEQANLVIPAHASTCTHRRNTVLKVFSMCLLLLRLSQRKTLVSCVSLAKSNPPCLF